jgi:ribosome biogenesis protein ENP2
LQVYTVSGGKNVPAWLSDKKKKALRKDEEYRRRIELIQDFEFPAGCQRIKITPDGQYIFASGYHPPQVPPLPPAARHCSSAAGWAQCCCLCCCT